MKRVISIMIIAAMLLCAAPFSAGATGVAAPFSAGAKGLPLPFELVAPANYSMTLQGGDSPTTMQAAYGLSNEMTYFFSRMDEASLNEKYEEFMADYGIDEIYITTQVDWALDDVDDPVSGWHCNEYWNYNKEHGYGHDDEGNYRYGPWDGVDYGLGNATETVNEHWLYRWINEDEYNGNPETHTPGLKDQMKPGQYSYDPEEGITIDFTEHTLYSRIRFAVRVIKYADEEQIEDNYYSDWSDVAAVGKDAEAYQPITASDIPAPVITGLRMTEKEFNDYPIAAYTLTVPDEVAALAVKAAAVHGSFWIEAWARVPGDEGWTQMQGSWEVTAGEMEIDLISLARVDRPVDANTSIDLRCRYCCDQPDLDDVYSEWSEILSFTGAEVIVHQHVWGAPTYEWSEDNSKCTGTVVCTLDDSHSYYETADAVPSSGDATCETAGTVTYTATFTDPLFTTQTKTVNGAALGHLWGDPTYVWADDNSTCTATRVCSRDQNHVEKETVNSTSETVTDTVCGTASVTTYTATFTNEAFDEQTKQVGDYGDFGHKWGEPTYEWAEDNTSCTATAVCKNDSEHVLTEKAEVTATTVKPTCTEKGYTAYEASFENSAFDRQEKKADEVAALGHKWSEVTYTWSKDHSACTAERICGNNAMHIERETVKADMKVVKESTYTEKGSKTYTAKFINPAFAEQTVTAEIPLKFKDVEPTAFYADAITWAVDNGITNGMGEGTFSPKTKCTRGQVVTFLWRTAGEPGVKNAKNPFTDVKEGAFYYDAVLWAVENNITSGISATTFGPGKDCTRGHVVTFLWRAKGEPKTTLTSNPFTDAKVGAFYYNAMLWAVEKGVTTGTSKTTFSPSNPCTRGQVVTFLHRSQTAK